MAGYLPASGSSLSMSQINSVFDSRGNNLNAYRGTTWYTAAGGSGTFSSGAISFNDFYLKGPSPAGVVDINDLVGTWVSYNAGTLPINVVLRFTPDGDVYMNSNGTSDFLYGGGFWITPPSIGIGSSYWISWTLVGTTGTNGTATATSGRFSLSTFIDITVTKSSGGTVVFDAEYDIEIWNAASGGTRVGYAPGVTIVVSRALPPP